MGLFSKKKEPPAPEARAPAPAPAAPALATNAPKAWPPIHATFVQGYHPTNTILLAGAMVRAFEAAGSGQRVAAVHQHLVFEDGILEVPVLVEENGVQRPVFLYWTADAEAGRNFAWAYAFLKGKGFPAPAYYAPAPLTPGPPKPQFRPFDYDLLRRVEEPQAAECFAWWSTPQEPRWEGSKVQAAMRRAYAAIDGYESYFCGRLLHHLGVAEEEKRLALPEEGASFFVEGPLGRRFFVSIGREKGIRLQFPAEDGWVEYRDLLWAHYASFCEAFRRLHEADGSPTDPPGERPLPWFTFLDEQMAKADAKGGREALRVAGIVRMPEKK